jgi:hypothetical protein
MYSIHLVYLIYYGCGWPVRMLAKITKSYQFRDGLDYEEFVSGTRTAIMAYAKKKLEPDNENRNTIDFDELQEENKITFVSWVDEPSTDPDYPDEPDHYWEYALEVHFLADVVEECKDEVVAI